MKNPRGLLLAPAPALDDGRVVLHFLFLHVVCLGDVREFSPAYLRPIVGRVVHVHGPPVWAFLSAILSVFGHRPLPATPQEEDNAVERLAGVVQRRSHFQAVALASGGYNPRNLNASRLFPVLALVWSIRVSQMRTSGKQTQVICGVSKISGLQRRKIRESGTKTNKDKTSPDLPSLALGCTCTPPTGHPPSC